jgi:hypothetical protein
MSAASDVAHPTGARGFWLGFAAYLLPSFPIAYVWHLVLFEQKYHALQIYRDEPVIAFGLASMIIQGAIFSWLFPRVFTQGSGSFVKDGLLYGLGAGLLSWSFTTLAVGAKNDGLRAGLCAARNRVHDPAIRHRGAVDRARLPKMMRRKPT